MRYTSSLCALPRKRCANMKRTYGWIKDKEDSRDRLYKLSRPRIATLKPFVDLRKSCSKVEDQGTLGSCTANALAGNIELLDKLIDGAYTDVSRIFLYYNERAMEGTISEDAGAMIRDGIKTLAKDGICAETLCPYDIEAFTRKPLPEAYEDAKKHLITSYMRITTLNEMLVCLSDGYPFVFGMDLYESFESDKISKTGKVPMPKDGEEYLGGHAVMAVGYNLITKQFIVRNSWGEGWGREGYFTIPFDYLVKYGADFWTVRK